MPHELKGGVSFTTSVDTMLQRPELSQKLAQINDNWNQTEYLLLEMYAYLMGHYIPREPGYHPPNHPVAYQVFDELEAFRPKLELFEALLRWALKRHPWKYRLYEKLVKRKLNSANKARNKLVHARWAVSEQYPDGLIFQPNFGLVQLWRISDLEQELKKVLAAKILLGKFHLKVRKIFRRYDYPAAEGADNGGS